MHCPSAIVEYGFVVSACHQWSFPNHVQRPVGIVPTVRRRVPDGGGAADGGDTADGGTGGGWWRYRPAIVDTVHRRYQLSSIPFTVHTVDTVNADDVIGRMGLTIAR
jgi:hypothetical protein